MTVETVEAIRTENDLRSAALKASMAKICQFCSSQRLEMRDEKVAQEALEAALRAAEFVIQREHRLSGRDIPDFLVSEGGFSIVLEMKTRAQRMQIYRQLERYAKHDQVDGIILLSGTATGVPEEIHGKPAMTASLGRGWLR